MGRRKRRRQNNPNDDRTPYVIAPKQNDLFEKYYKIQNIILEEEFETFLEVLRQPLPTTFRITSFKSHSSDVLSFVKENYFASLINASSSNPNTGLMNNRDERLNIGEASSNVDEPINIGQLYDVKSFNVGETFKSDKLQLSSDETLKNLSWYPNELAWQLNLDRKNIRQNLSLKSLHQFLVQETESGNISRQEAVSMLPPMVLNVQSNSRVLDMCAAPGSKTVQLVEYLHTNNSNPNIAPEGYVIANDSDNKRCYLMVHQINRLSSANYAVMNMDASNLPNLYLDGTVVKFDKILCDVPCSGDGTLRKNLDAWGKWNPGAANGLHNLQRRILRRGIEMLSDGGGGGELVYSTCSFNPVENEAVIANILIENRGSLELVDLSDLLKNLKWRPGLTSWKVMTKKEELFENYASVPERLKTQINESIFPPPADVLADLNLDRCVRILPHHQNTGGFFLALLRKTPKLENPKEVKNSGEPCNVTEIKSDLIGGSNGDSHSPEDENETISTKRKLPFDNSLWMNKKVKHFGYKEDPFIFLKDEDEIWNPICKFYGITGDFPFSQLMVRCDTGKKRNIYFVSRVIKDLVQANEGRFKFINFGVKILSRSEHKEANCQFRLVQDAIHILYPYVTKRIVIVTKEDVIILLTSENPYINRLSKSAGDQINPLGQGGCIYVCNDLIRDGDERRRLILCGWKGKVSCRSFLPKNDREHILRLCGHIPVQKTSPKSKIIDGKDDSNDENIDVIDTSNHDIEDPLENDIDDIETTT